VKEEGIQKKITIIQEHLDLISDLRQELDECDKRWQEEEKIVKGLRTQIETRSKQMRLTTETMIEERSKIAINKI